MNDKAQHALLRTIWATVRYWNEEEVPRREALEGLAFSILAMLDGEVSGLPGYVVIPTDEIATPENDIAGSLHEQFLSHRMYETA